MATHLHTDPYLDDGMRGYIYKTAITNHGRIANFDVDDLVQEGYFCYYKCRSRYVGKEGLKKRDGTPCRFLPETNPDTEAKRHFQSLVFTTFSNVISTLALKQPRGWELAITDLTALNQSTDAAWDALLPASDELATVTLQLQSAPIAVRRLLALLVKDAVQLPSYRRFGKRRFTSRRETTNQWFCRLLHLPPGTDIIGQVNKHFLLN